MDSTPPHLVHVFATFVAAGPQIRTVRMINALSERYRHTLIPCDGKAAAFDLIAAPQLAKLCGAPARRRGLGTIAAMRRLLAELQPDLLLTYNWGSMDAVLAARFLARLPLLHHEDGFNDDEAVRQKRRRVWARRFALRRAARLIVPSARLAAIARDCWRVPEERIAWIPNGIDTLHFAPGVPQRDWRNELAIPAEAHVIGAVGHLRPVKNYARLIAACAQIRAAAVGLRPVHLVMLGDGPERSLLERAAQAQPPPGGKVHFVGHQTDLREWYRGMDLFALSSDSEQHPVALIEAMACALPFVATDVGDVRLVAPHKQTPYIVPLGEQATKMLALALEALLAQSAERHLLGQANRDRACERYSFAAMLARYQEIYASLLA